MTYSKTIFFDMGNVLLYFSFPRMCEQIGQVLGLPAHIIHKEITENDLGGQYEKGKIDSSAYHEHFCKLAGKKVPLDDLLEAASNIFNPNSSILPVLAELKRKGHRLFVLSNTCDAHFSYAVKHYPEMLAPFDDFILSYEVGAMKPEEKIFKAALQKSGANPSHCFYTDDIPAFIEAAARVDIPGVVFTGNDDLIETLRARGLL